MPEPEEMEVVCPQCAAKQTATIMKTLDVKANPAIRDALFQWEINVFNCDKCGFKAQLPIRLHYTDENKGISIIYFPMDELGNPDFYTEFNKKGEPNEKTDDRPHIVFDMAELMRYIVFREVVLDKGVD
jgi:hypothetical protein